MTTATKPDAAMQARIAARAAHLQDTLTTLRAQLANRPEPQKTPPQADKPAPMYVATNPNRPKSLNEVIGQNEVTMQLRTVIAGAQLRGERIPHCLLVGGPGLGKTTLAQIVADEVGVPMVKTSGMLLKKAPDLIGLLVGTEGKQCVIFVDEIHAAAKVCQETLYSLCEDGTVDTLGGSGPDTVATTQYLPNIIIVGATTAPGKLSQPFRDRFGFIGTMGQYSLDEISQIVERYWKNHGKKAFRGESMAVAQRSKLVPRKAIHLAERVLDYAAISESDTINTGMTAEALAVFGIDANGLDRQDVAVLRSLVKDFSGRPTGVDAVAQRLCMDVSTLTESIEPYLAQAGYLVRTKGGRVATAKAHELVREEV